MTREILEQLWQYEFYEMTGWLTITSRISEESAGRKPIETVKGVGYRIAKLSEKPFDS